jgi:hypothetical protein
MRVENIVRPVKNRSPLLDLVTRRSAPGKGITCHRAIRAALHLEIEERQRRCRVRIDIGRSEPLVFLESAQRGNLLSSPGQSSCLA